MPTTVLSRYFSAALFGQGVSFCNVHRRRTFLNFHSPARRAPKSSHKERQMNFVKPLILIVVIVIAAAAGYLSRGLRSAEGGAAHVRAVTDGVSRRRIVAEHEDRRWRPSSEELGTHR
jgi:hypothetical protein